MKRRTLVILGILAVCVFLLAQNGKFYAPQYFGNAWIQHGSAVFLALLCPIGALFSLKLIHEGLRWSGCWLLLVFCVPVVTSLAVYAISGPLLGRFEASMKPTRNEYGAIARISEFCITPEVDPSKRLDRAAFAYHIWGIKLPLMYKDGSVALFVPHGADEKGLKETIEVWRTQDQTENMIEDQLRQMPWISGLYLGSWCLVFGVGLTWFAYRGKRNTPSLNSPALRQENSAGF